MPCSAGGPGFRQGPGFTRPTDEPVCVHAHEIEGLAVWAGAGKAVGRHEMRRAGESSRNDAGGQGAGPSADPEGDRAGPGARAGRAGRARGPVAHDGGKRGGAWQPAEPAGRRGGAPAPHRARAACPGASQTPAPRRRRGPAWRRAPRRWRPAAAPRPRLVVRRSGWGAASWGKAAPGAPCGGRTEGAGARARTALVAAHPASQRAASPHLPWPRAPRAPRARGTRAAPSRGGGRARGGGYARSWPLRHRPMSNGSILPSVSRRRTAIAGRDLRGTRPRKRVGMRVQHERQAINNWAGCRSLRARRSRGARATPAATPTQGAAAAIQAAPALCVSLRRAWRTHRAPCLAAGWERARPRAGAATLSCAAAAPWVRCPCAQQAVAAARPARRGCAPRCTPLAPGPGAAAKAKQCANNADALAALRPARLPHQSQNGEGTGTDHHTTPTGAQRSRAASRWGGNTTDENRTTAKC
jgi:hypothetical protein